jgi:hypothetical protein
MITNIPIYTKKIKDIAEISGRQWQFYTHLFLKTRCNFPTTAFIDTECMRSATL